MKNKLSDLNSDQLRTKLAKNNGKINKLLLQNDEIVELLRSRALKPIEISQRYILEEPKPLTADELKSGGWWCDDISEVCRLAFVEKGVATRFADWSFEGENKYCYLSGIVVARTGSLLNGLKQIHRIGNEFYWSEV